MWNLPKSSFFLHEIIDIVGELVVECGVHRNQKMTDSHWNGIKILSSTSIARYLVLSLLLLFGNSNLIPLDHLLPEYNPSKQHVPYIFCISYGIKAKPASPRW